MEQAYKTHNLAEPESSPSSLPEVRVDGTEEMVPAFQVLTDRALGKVDVRHYSLAQPSATEVEGRSPEVVATPRIRKSLTEPVREVTLDPARMEPRLVSFYHSDPPAAEEYNKLAVALISVAAKRPCKRVLIASAQQGEGRTCVTLNLASALARANQRVLVVDGDLLHPSVLRLLGIHVELGLAEVIARGLTPGAATVRILPSGFNVMATRGRVDNAAELLASPALQGILQMLDPDYDFILFDSPPLLVSADAHLLQRFTDTTLLVIRPGVNSTAQMARALALFAEEDLCGVVLNRVVS
jgi:Mrp family chromosome partitioning ATPase